MNVTLVPTPIGNLEDITLRALRVLKESDAVACEDTRHTGALLKHFDIRKPLIRLDQHTISNAKVALEGYDKVAYCSDAGTPGISDPGHELVKIALQEGWKVEVLPGATAVIPALVLSGLPTARFCFEGFLPQKRSERLERLKQLESGRTMVLYESPHKLRDTLEDLQQALGKDHKVAVVRELSKLYEEAFRGTLEQALTHFNHPRGEFVLVLQGQEAQIPILDVTALIAELSQQGLSGKALVKALTDKGVSRNEAYTAVHNNKP